jgi:hypothetical protein
MAAAVALLPGGGASVDAVAQARAALSPTGEIVHMVVRTNFGGRIQTAPIEQWYAADPERWRVLQRPSRPARDRGGPATPPHEVAVSGDRLRSYDPRRDVMTIFRGIGDHPRPALPIALGGDPTSELRERLAAGDVRDDGVVTVDGRAVRRLVSERDAPGGQFVYYMDPQTFAPIGGRLYLRFGGRRATAIEFTVDDYERLPLNAETEQLLKIRTTADTRFVWRDLGRR